MYTVLPKECNYTMLFDGVPSAARSTLQGIFKHARNKILADDDYHIATIIDVKANAIVLMLDTRTFKPAYDD